VTLLQGNRWSTLVFASILMVGACSSVVMDTVKRAEQLSPLTADPGELAVSVVLSEGLEVTEVRLTLDAQNAVGESVSGDWVLQESSDVDGRRRFAIAQDDLDDVRMKQLQAAQWELSDPEGSSVLHLT
jgi:hypothetical protein